MKTPYNVIISRHITEKSTVLEQLQHKTSNKSLARCKSPKYVFIVDPQANKQEIKEAIETIYKPQNVKVTKVNTICTKSKPKRRGKGRPGQTATFKKAIVTLESGDSLEKA